MKAAFISQKLHVYTKNYCNKRQKYFLANETNRKLKRYLTESPFPSLGQKKEALFSAHRVTKNHFFLFSFSAACRLSLFGSSVNNFGFRGSDLDICLRFGSDAPPPGLDPSNMVVKVAKALDKHGDFHKVMYIKSAKVPIVKFVIKNLELDGDISLYNCLALNNSRMLKMYSLIDKRVRIIGYCAKVFAKVSVK